MLLFTTVFTSIIASMSHAETPGSYSSSTPYLAVGTAKTKKSALAVLPLIERQGVTEAHRKEFTQTLQNDLAFLELFQWLPPTSFIEPADRHSALKPDGFRFSDWKSIGADIHIRAALQITGKTARLEAYGYDLQAPKTLVAKEYVGESRDIKNLIRSFEDDLIQALTGQAGIFHTKIVMSCDRTGKKEIYLMDFDGSDVKQLTHHQSISMSPAWHPAGQKIAYSLYTKHRGNIKNLDLYELDFASNTIHLVSNKTGLNTGAAYSPDGKKIAMTLSFLGNPEIFLYDTSSENVTRLTNSVGFDVDPVFSPDGRSLAFVSARSGKPMVYKMLPDGSAPQRLTFAGSFNATPAFSPNGSKIVFAGWLDSRFDLFLMNADGTNIERLTKNQGGNEDPSFSPDGSLITFSSNRSGQKNIYVMNVDGTFAKRLTFGLGNCVSPKWSPYLSRRTETP